MALTYPTLGTVAPGDVLRANSGTAAYNNIITSVNQHRKPPACRVYRSSDWTYSGTYISWNASAYDTESPSDPMFTASSTDVTVRTAGIYLVVANYYYTCAASNTWMGLRIHKSGVGIARGSSPAYNTTQGFVSLSAVINATVGQTFQVSHDPFGGSSFVAKGGTEGVTSDITSLTVTWLGQTS